MGKDFNRGDMKEPWQSVSYAMSNAHPGDTIFMRAGDYTSDKDVVDSQRFVVPSGTDLADGAITLAGYPGEVVNWIPPAGVAPIRLTETNPSYLIFKNFSISGVNQTDSRFEPELIYTSNFSHHCRFQNLELGHCMINAISWSTKGTGVNGGYAPYSSYHQLIDCVIHHAGAGTWDGGHGGPGRNNGYGCYTFTDNNLFLRNVWRDGYAYGMNVYGSFNDIVGNIAYNNGTRGGTTFGINVGSNAYSQGHQGAHSKNNRLWNNLVFKNHNSGICIYTETELTELWNNTVFGNQDAGLFFQYLYSARVGNNISFGNGVEVADYSPGLVEYITNLFEDPSFVDPANDDYHLLNTSKAISRGTTIDFVPHDADAYARPQGSAYCIGAYEFRESNPDPIDPIPPTDEGCCCCCKCNSAKKVRR